MGDMADWSIENGILDLVEDDDCDGEDDLCEMPQEQGWDDDCDAVEQE